MTHSLAFALSIFAILAFIHASSFGKGSPMLEAEEHAWVADQTFNNILRRCEEESFGCKKSKLEKYSEISRKMGDYWIKFNTASNPLSIQAKYMVISNLIKNTFHECGFVGFYTVEFDEGLGREALIIAPYASNILATPKIDKGKGVCGEAWQRGKTMIVADVTSHPNYIACDDVTLSEIVVPYFDARGQIKAVFDVDGEVRDYFDVTDKIAIEELLKMLNL